MEGWLYGVFTLLGVLVGGFFTYLGLRKQLAQQKEINEIEWRRKVRSEPLLKLRNELAKMANKQNSLVIAAQGAAIKTPDSLANEISQEFQDWSAHISDYQVSLYIQYDKEIVEVVEKIMSSYQKSWIETLSNGKTSLDKLNKAMKTSKTNQTRIIEAQELINSRLEEL
jgi:hypothetical protein